MADAPKPADRAADKPAERPTAAVPTSLMTVPPVVPFTPPERPATPPGGKFGITEVETSPDGKRTEKLRYVNAHGRPFSDDPNENMKEK